MILRSKLGLTIKDQNVKYQTPRYKLIKELLRDHKYCKKSTYFMMKTTNDDEEQEEYLSEIEHFHWISRNVKTRENKK
jgi:hypothetical protein